MSSCYLPTCLKKWSLLFFLFIFLGVFATASSCFAACEYLSSGDFSSGSGWTVNDTTYWSIVNGMLDADGMVNDTSVYAKTAFSPDGFFSADVEVSIVSSRDQYDRVGIRFRTSGDVLFGVNGDSGQITTNGVLCYYYPTAGLLKFKVYDMLAGEWVTPIAARSVSGTVNSIGFSMVADGVIFRVNGQDTTYKLSGDFSFGPSVVDHLYLYAGSGGDAGGTLHARFDNVCASSYEVTDFQPGNAMPLPNGKEVLTTTPAASPVTSIVPASANPFGFGPVASGGNILSLTAGLSGLSAPVDLYVGIGIGAEIYLFDAANGIHPLSTDGLVKWRANTTGGLNNVPLLPPGIDMSGIPGTYNFYFLLTPAGRLDSFRLWVTPLVIAGGGGGSSTVTDTAMRDEIKQNIDLIFGITSGFSGGLSELMAVFSDKNVVNMSPSMDSIISDAFSGAPIPSPITVNADFGSGYTMASGAVMSGSAKIVLSNVKFSSQVTGADFSGTVNNVMKNGAPFASGKLSGQILMTKISDGLYNVSGHIDVNNLSISGQPMSGTIGISGTMGTLDFNAFMKMDLAKLLKTTGDITLSFTNFISGAYTINSGTVHITNTQNGHGTISTDLQTSQGRVILNMTSATSATGAVINTTSPGAAGPYTLSMNNVTLDQNACANYPTGGTMSFTSNSTGKTGVVTFNGACDGSYGYGER